MENQEITSTSEVRVAITHGDGHETVEKPDNNPGKGGGSAAPHGNGSVAP